ncbi:MAG: hypothetical protein ACKO5M_00060 [Vulcanococcus sp.]
MREIVFRVQELGGDRLRANAEHPPLTIEAATLEELQHEAREALINQYGPAHVAYRVRILRPSNRIQPRHRTQPSHSLQGR